MPSAARTPVPADTGQALGHADPGFARRLTKALAHMNDATEPPKASPSRMISRREPLLLNIKPKRRSLLKRVERYFSGILKLGRTYGTVKEARKAFSKLEVRISALEEDIAALQSEIQEDDPRITALESNLNTRLDSLRHDLATIAGLGLVREEARNAVRHLRTELDETSAVIRRVSETEANERIRLSRAFSDLTRRVDAAPAKSASPAPHAAEPADEPGLNSLLDAFYTRLEDRYRGSREEIGQRLQKYLPDAEAVVKLTGKPILDLGCGRGEWLESLKAAGLEAVGVDLNDMQLGEARARGLDVRLGEATAFLADTPDDAFAMVTAHHLAEHLEFRTLVQMTREAVRVLAPGGMLLFETPNARNVVVGASSFHVDPTHIRPLPAEVLTTLFETVGLRSVEARFLHPHPKYSEMIEAQRLDSEIAGLLFGPQDLAVLGTKPAEAAD